MQFLFRKALLNRRKPWLIMRLILFFILAGLFQVSGKGFSQNISLNVKDVSLESVFKSIKKQAGYVFFYDANLINDSRQVNLHVKNVSIETILNEVFPNSGVKWTIEKKTITLYGMPNKPVSSTPLEIADLPPPITIEGLVTDKDKNPLEGVSVTISGTNKGTSTNRRGEYKLEGVDDQATLVFSMIGFSSQTVPINKRSKINISLLPAINEQEEIIVVGYGTSTRASFTGSATTLKSDVLAKTPRVSIQETLQGNAPGVMVSSGSGEPGSVPYVSIRGIGSINAGKTPLYVVDGVPLEASGVQSLNANDIETLSVLKDAAAASIYGSRAANGVILITTKSGRKGKTVINATSQFGFNNVTMNDDQKPLRTKEVMELMREGWVNSGKDLSSFEAEVIKNAVDTTIDTDWFDALTRQGAYQQYDISASGGNEQTQFYLSGGYFNSKGALLGTDFKRYNVNLKIQNQATDRLSISGGLKLNHRVKNGQADAGSSGNPVRMYKRYMPWLKIYNDDGSYDLSYANLYNPVAVVKENWARIYDYGLLGNILLKYEIAKALTLENQSSIDFNYQDENNFYKSGIGTARTNGGQASFYTGRTANLVNTAILRYKKSFGDHALNAFAGYEAEQVKTLASSLSKENFLPGTVTLDNASVLRTGGTNESANTLVSSFLNGSYNFQSKYYVSASVRRDGSSRFGSARRFGTFWSLGASWNINAEDFFQNQHIFSQLRLRASYGVNGNQDLGNFASRALYRTSDYLGLPGYLFTNYGNDLLTWEKNKPFNVGLDFGLLNNRLTGTVEFYERVTTDLLLDQPISGTNGRTSLTDNVGEMKNSGIEIELNSRNIVSTGNGFEWTSSLNFSTLKNRITKLNSPIVGSSYNRYEGGDYYQLYLIGYAGADPQTGESMWYTDDSKKETTNDYNKAGFFNQGSALPKFFGGFTNILNYNKFALSFMVYYNVGNKIYDNWGSNASSDGGKGFSATDNMSRYYYNNRWQKPGDITDAPKVVYKGSQSGSSSHNSARFLYDGDYLRLRDVSLSYDLKTKGLQNAGISGLRFYVRGSNLLTFVKDKRMVFDPEVSMGGMADQNAPLYRTFLFGIDISL